MQTRYHGSLAEQKALTYLIEQGLTLVTQNFNCRLGELDLVMRDGIYWVMVEVRSRTGSDYGGGAASITYAKRQKIIKAASYYLMKRHLSEQVPVRFDVISIDGKSEKITWLKDAFNVD